jgi:hypothetical protein
VEIVKRDFESEKLKKRISRQASVEASFKGGKGAISGCRSAEEEEVYSQSQKISKNEMFPKDVMCVHKKWMYDS